MKAKNFARNARIFEAVMLGSTWAETAAAEGITGARAGQVARKLCRMMLHPRLFNGEISLDGDYCLQDLRKHSAFWLSQLAKLRAEHDIGSLVSA